MRLDSNLSTRPGPVSSPASSSGGRGIENQRKMVKISGADTSYPTPSVSSAVEERYARMSSSPRKGNGRLASLNTPTGTATAGRGVKDLSSHCLTNSLDFVSFFCSPNDNDDNEKGDLLSLTDADTIIVTNKSNRYNHRGEGQCISLASNRGTFETLDTTNSSVSKLIVVPVDIGTVSASDISYKQLRRSNSINSNGDRSGHSTGMTSGMEIPRLTNTKKAALSYSENDDNNIIDNDDDDVANHDGAVDSKHRTNRQHNLAREQLYDLANEPDISLISRDEFHDIPLENNDDDDADDGEDDDEEDDTHSVYPPFKDATNGIAETASVDDIKNITADTVDLSMVSMDLNTNFGEILTFLPQRGFGFSETETEIVLIDKTLTSIE